jgi:hypothetical protein
MSNMPSNQLASMDQWKILSMTGCLEKNRPPTAGDVWHSRDVGVHSLADHLASVIVTGIIDKNLPVTHKELVYVEDIR